MKVFSSTSHFGYDWEHVSTANWQKYSPWNEKSTHVIAVDTLSRHVDASTGILRTERLITCQQSAPRWLTAILGSQEQSIVYEVSYVDPLSKKLTLCSQNMTWSDLLSVRETVTYTPSPHNTVSSTQFHQTAKITALCGGWQNIKNKIETFSIQRFGENAAKGREGFEMVLERAREVFREEREKVQMTGQAA
ncbi:gb [Venturia nashicola]|uniref:Gb n=1 Tax=Venturia nashicola TaxID=86259 RepID=A0A4Z1NJ46_9PEZI|nr:gb [Venturia nashicola]TLD22571.1 gb [Venturia nashicola]